MRYELKNDCISVEIDSHGAEIKSIQKNGTEYMWSGDPKYWGRTSPVLFPFVGSVSNGVYRIDDTEYPMGQHGFARDMEFTLSSQSSKSLVFSLSSNEETLRKYPFDFVLKITYTIEENTLIVSWMVENPSEAPMYFSIGAHPAFNCPIKDGNQCDYKLKFNSDNDIEYFLLKNGLIDKSKKYTLSLNNGYSDIIPGMFDNDALIIEDGQASEISLCYPDGSEYVTVKTSAPLFGIWSPAKKNAPFICIEPWYGRCDADGFTGELSEREYSNTLRAGEIFRAEYTVEFN